MSGYGWVPVFMDLAGKFYDYRNDRDGFDSLFKRVFSPEGEEGFSKLSFNGPDTEYRTVDPFTVFCAILKDKLPQKRIETINRLGDVFDVSSARLFSECSFEGVPSVFATNTWRYFGGAEYVERGDVDKLWELFCRAYELVESDNSSTREEFVKIFDVVLGVNGKEKVAGNGVASITDALFDMRPDYFFGLDKNGLDFVCATLGRSPKELQSISGLEYLEMLDDLKRAYPEKRMCELSKDAYENSLEKEMEKAADDWEPSEEEFNPEISEESWIEVLGSKKEKSQSSNPEVWDSLLQALSVLGGADGATWQKISEKYGKSPETYQRNIIVLGEFAADYCGIRQRDNQWGNKEAWSIPCKRNGERFKVRPELAAAFEYFADEIASSASCLEEGLGMKVKEPRMAKNIILYGPPGTGKTYNTISYAVAICDGIPILDDVERETAKKGKTVKGRYDELIKEGRVEFVTFHQSYGYEEFVEGIRPVIGDSPDSIGYAINSGVFKRICADDNGFEEAWKKFYQDVEESDDPIAIKTLKGKPLLLATTRSGFKRYKENGEEHGFFNYDQCLRVYQGLSGTPKGGLDNYRLAIVNHLKEKYGLADYQQSDLPRVLIIDEINRGNISKIFGELITLIEESKRKGGKDEIAVTLPYSGEAFSVPSNLYILGTMNTADRSIALMDTALRRRFSFIEMMPEPNRVGKDPIDGIDVREVMTKINARIEALYDREHTIGHSYFMDVETLEDLRDAFADKVIPLLQEYFYDDYEKIRMVLGDDLRDLQEEYQFVCKVPVEDDLFYGGNGDYVSDGIYQVNKKALEHKESFKKIYDPKVISDAQGRETADGE